jgi:Sulfotransferase domain
MIDWKGAFKQAITPLYRPAFNQLRSTLMIDNSGDWRDTLYVSTGGRTGGTWVSQLINFDLSYRLMFEPASREYLMVPREYLPMLRDNRLQYIRPSSADPELMRRAENVITGRFRQGLTDQYNYTPRIVFKKRLIKETKSNLYAKWLHDRFAGMPIMLLLRHPISAIMSRQPDYFDLPPAQRAATDDEETRTRDYRLLTLGQPELMQDFLEPYRPVIEAAKGVFAQRMVVWCIQNYVPLHQFKPGEVHLAFYEDFCIDPVKQMRRLREFLGTELREDEAERIRTRSRKPSSTLHRTAIHGFREPSEIQGYEQIAKWTKRVQPDEQREAAETLRAFGLDGVYSATDPVPNYEGAAALMRANAELSPAQATTS